MTSVRKTHAALEGKPLVTGFFEPRTSSVQYIVADPATQRCAIIDPVLDFDEKSGTTATHSAETLLNHVQSNGLQVEWILDTHPHADHLSAAGYLKERTGAPTAIGAHVVEVQTLWKELYNLGDNFTADGSQWDHLFDDGERFQIGALAAAVLFSPGHTLASITYRIGDAAFIHDTLFMPDGGTARADFPGGNARQLWHSIEAILALPDQTRLFTGHDYQPGGREPRWESTIGQQKAENAHVKGQDPESFVRLRTERDRRMPMPKLILHSLQVNISGGNFAKPEDNGRRYLKVPLDLFGDVPWS
jgi:glyoxylase-like metal-dependent hydrolase (beta-lactamase superfamily II)